jgi:UPF0716 protein FxsA
MERMFLILLALFIAVPIAEIYVIVQVGHSIGALNTLLLLVVVSVLGAWLVKVQGLSVLARIEQRARAGQVPTNELVDGLILLLAGVLMLVPGFITDALGIVLILPPTRAGVRHLLLRRYRRRIDNGTYTSRNNRVWSRVIVDVDSRDDDRPKPPRGELPPN